MDLKELVEIAGRNWRILDLLLRAQAEGDDESRYVHGLAKQVGKRDSEMSLRLKQLEKAQLVKAEQRSGGRRKYYKLTTKGSGIVCAITGAAESEQQAPVDIKETDPEQLTHALKRLDAVTSEEARKAALEDFRQLCSTTRVWEHGRRVWPIIRKHLSNAAGCLDWANVLLDMVTSMQTVDAKKFEEEVKKEFFDELTKAYLDSVTSKHTVFSVVVHQIIWMLGSEAEKIRIYKAAWEKLIRAEKAVEDENEYGQIVASINSLLDFALSQERKKNLRDWFYMLMQDENEAVRKKALRTYENAGFKIHGWG